ncbi:hypothetical protein NPIL_181621 [Nephila pilipes]|uniref:Histone-lysine N-methyltransferase SETMAR n=1 Tax=Nephila pilipes TaxID=299642 RepID=A0A8X6PJX9_NEPPI|nr:hypothetical protein NPIL_181621 [Nephila pilipes]
MEHVLQALQQKEPALVNHKDIFLFHDIRPYVEGMVRDTIQQLSWETLYHPPYSFDFVPFDYHLFHSLGSYLHGKFSPIKQTCTKHSQTSLH